MPRPATNVFASARRRAGEKIDTPPFLDARRRMFLAKHENWALNPLYKNRLKSNLDKEWGDPRYDLRRGSELAMIVVGRRSPEKHDMKHFHLQDYIPMDVELFSINSLTRRAYEHPHFMKYGPKLVPEVVFKTLSSCLVAKLVVYPKGGHWRALPSAREIAQIWYVLFGEEESSEAIRSRLRYCAQLVSWSMKPHPTSYGPTRRYLPKLCRAIIKSTRPRKKRARIAARSRSG
ncbi:hypothetical protein [Maritimibacter alexandrii]|uniref:hypothetical protein n=1 Tax=Maritimibacter alexandrii TaxID=2570355 RepID=UPI001109FF83|nr:hypothetical protein [Maritimibacter alexandrii]